MQRRRIWFNKGFSGNHNLIQALRAHPQASDLEVLSSHTDPTAVSLVGAHESFIEPKLLAEDYVDYCLEVCRTRRIDVLVAGKQMTHLADARERFLELGTRVLVAADGDTMRHFDDKEAFLNAFDRSIVDVPDYRAVRTLAEFDAAVEALGGVQAGLCFKPARGIFGSGFRILTADDDLDALLGGDTLQLSLRAARALFGSRARFRSVLVMRYAEGVERSVDVLAHRGELVRCVTRRKTGQGAQLLEDYPRGLEIARELTRRYGLSGIYNFQLKDLAGEPRLLEINPRPSGGLNVAMASGLNYPYWAVRLELGEADPSEVPAPRSGLRVAQLSAAVPVGLPVEAV
ncbi:carbamoylphosphate synthase large subunit [Deinobacterium chartae]|uniref:Carbamoylphosphate synthase large subunit n=1 Tax=Deinobacterium chartae TaxID=521158 RepID=A0A841I2R6_9DEIO|nr:ATP-grasp domain-containing protein [Deinobacterium chartae]MBB6098638.1 carbamoylphosphate synthase large subunit [Deinobacterium chartae]